MLETKPNTRVDYTNSRGAPLVRCNHDLLTVNIKDMHDGERGAQREQ
jgi:hypothetical protein